MLTPKNNFSNPEIPFVALLCILWLIPSSCGLSFRSHATDALVECFTSTVVILTSKYTTKAQRNLATMSNSFFSFFGFF
jgi:hypothetical protein